MPKLEFTFEENMSKDYIAKSMLAIGFLLGIAASMVVAICSFS